MYVDNRHVIRSLWHVETQKKTHYFIEISGNTFNGGWYHTGNHLLGLLKFVDRKHAGIYRHVLLICFVKHMPNGATESQDNADHDSMCETQSMDEI